jgi:hypothetical protein
MTYRSELTSRNIAAFVKSFNKGNPDERDNYKAALELTQAFISNKTYKNIFIKVNFINGAFKTAIGDTQGVAKQVFSNVKNIDRKLENGNTQLIKEIEHYKSKEMKIRKNYSFATKYCHCHQPELYPIYDDYVYRSLIEFNKRYHFCTFTKGNIFEYDTFKEILTSFTKCIKGPALSIATIDRFLWALGREAKAKKRAKKERDKKRMLKDMLLK